MPVNDTLDSEMDSDAGGSNLVGSDPDGNAGVSKLVGSDPDVNASEMVDPVEREAKVIDEKANRLFIGHDFLGGTCLQVSSLFKGA